MWDALDPRSDDARDHDRSDPRELQPADPRDVFTRDLDLPRGAAREPVEGRDREYTLRGSEVRTLATLGTFRVVPLDDLTDDRGPADLSHGDLAHLRRSGLIRVVAPLDREGGMTNVLTLTDSGRDVLERHRHGDPHGRQTFYTGPAKLRELSHDAQLARAYTRTAARLHGAGARIHRVVLDHELKRDYQRFLQDGNRHRPDSDGRPTRSREEIDEWAHEHRLPHVDGHVQFPDFRIEYDTPDGRRDAEDVEVTTRHYRGAHAAAKGRSGFSRMRAGGGRVGGGSGRRGSRASAVHIAEEFLE
jgi:hypothetical protein